MSGKSGRFLLNQRPILVIIIRTAAGCVINNAFIPPKYTMSCVLPRRNAFVIPLAKLPLPFKAVLSPRFHLQRHVSGSEKIIGIFFEIKRIQSF